MRTLAAKIVRLDCDCGHQFESCLCASEGWQKPCPSCGAKCGLDNVSRHRRNSMAGNRRFGPGEDTSITDFYHPDEVGEARRLFSGTGARINDNGTVQFDDRATERKYRAVQEQLERRATALDPARS